MKKKGLLSRIVRLFREGVKHVAVFLTTSLFRYRSYPIFGIPSGLTAVVEGKQQLYPEAPLPLSPPQTLEKNVFWRFQAALKGIQLLEDGVFILQRGTATCTGGNLTKEGKLVTTFLQAIDGKPPHRHDLFRFSTKRFFPRIYKSGETVATLSTGWQGAFYHWVYEVLPRLHLAEKSGHCFNKIYVQAHTPFQKESLELLGISPDNIINAQEYEAVQAPQLIIPSVPQIPNPWGCDFLRRKILPKLDKGPPIRLYISRNDASKRRILNEKEIYPVLKKYGFERVELSGLDFKEQAELFYSAEAIVGAHGAGFSHLVFCRPGIPILEIFSPAYVNPSYWYVANQVNLPYYYLFGEGERYPDFVDPHLDPDIIVDKEKLEATLELALPC